MRGKMSKGKARSLKVNSKDFFPPIKSVMTAHSQSQPYIPGPATLLCIHYYGHRRKEKKKKEKIKKSFPSYILAADQKSIPVA